jgi:cytochrome c oxidase cbb3-type subunit III
MHFPQAMAAAAALLTAATLGAQQAPSPPPPPPRPPAVAPVPAHPPAEGDPDAPKFDPAAVERGKQLQITHCGFCHGSNARGGQQGPDLTRSEIVQSDENGKQLGAFLKVGRPEKGMPKSDLPEQDVLDLATFLHATIEQVSNRGKYQILNILVGDPKKGEAFFGGAGKCTSCHSVTGDLRGVASKYEDPATLQGRLVMPRGRRPRRGPRQPGQTDVPPYLEPTAVKATVTLPSGESFTGPLMLLTDFDVTVFDAARQQPRTWLRRDGSPRVVLTDPLQAHIDLWRRWTDDDLHDMTAFLATLK